MDDLRAEKKQRKRHAGHFKPGQSGNPGGRPKDELGLRALARTYSGEALEKLVQIMRDKKTSSVARVRAIGEILDRGYGRPKQEILVDKPPVDAKDLYDVARRLAVLFRLTRARTEAEAANALPKLVDKSGNSE